MNAKRPKTRSERNVTIARNILSCFRYFMIIGAVFVLVLEPRNWTTLLCAIVGAIYTSKIIYDVDHHHGEWRDVVFLRMRRKGE